MRKFVTTIADVQAGEHMLYAICRNDGCRHMMVVDLPLLLKRVKPTDRLLPRRHERHFTDSMRCPSCRWRGVRLWLEPAEQKRQILQKPSAPPKQPNFLIVADGDTGLDVIATADNLMVGKGAYAAAALFYADKRITLKQGIFVIEDSKSGKPIEVLTAERYKAMREAERFMGNNPIQPFKLSSG